VDKERMRFETLQREIQQFSEQLEKLERLG
jgi:hypothetical protein